MFFALFFSDSKTDDGKNPERLTPYRESDSDDDDLPKPSPGRLESRWGDGGAYSLGA